MCLPWFTTRHQNAARRMLVDHRSRVASEDPTNSLVNCALHGMAHGPDHGAIKTTFDASGPVVAPRERLLLKIRASAKPYQGTAQQKTDGLICSQGGDPRSDTQAIAALETMVDKRPGAATSNLQVLEEPSSSGKACWVTRTDSEEMAKRAAKQYHDAIRQ
ncbi:reverse transcriptase [Colletotrichum tofieldiae]|uniref:Reverse transcriptase n=1 Tax=Colletotrichum tofieldiae TaxID=708197 RepID=A0A161YDQ7_9PEZI|nr:reverse transcriptase [Colletotrichum tofieldiae]